MLRAILRPKANFVPFTDGAFLKKINKRAGLNFEIKVQKSPLIFGYMPSIPIKPVMVISSSAREHLTDDELEWLVLHEAGHCVLWHTVKETLVQIAVLVFGIVTVYSLKLSLLLIPVYAILLGIIWYQLERFFELQADNFSLNRMSNPEGMITANQKMKSRVKNIIYKTPILIKLLTPHPTYDQRMEMARAK